MVERTVEVKNKKFDHINGWMAHPIFSNLRLEIFKKNPKYISDVCDDYPWHAPDCRNGGYANPNDCTQCLCPDGFAAPFCDTVQQGHVGGKPSKENLEIKIFFFILKDNYNKFNKI